MRQTHSYVGRVYCEDFDIVRMDFDLQVWQIARNDKNLGKQQIADMISKATGGKVCIEMFLDETLFQTNELGKTDGIMMNKGR